MKTEEKYCIIGAGPAGLSGAKNLKDLGIPFDGYDAGKDVGGLWNIENPLSTMYESAHLISSKKMTEFKDFPMRNEMAKLVAKFIKANEAHSPKAEKFKAAKKAPYKRLTGGFNYIKLDRMAFYVHKDTYRKAILGGIKSL